MAKIITLGEIMIRLTPPNKKRFTQTTSFDVVYGGSEANVAVSLANYGHDVSFVSKLPKNEIGQSALNELKKHGVDTNQVQRGGERIGIYYLEDGVSMRPSRVIYDRHHTAISQASIEEFDFVKIFKGAKWFHFSGITPALSAQAASLVEYACKKAKENDVKISCDLNYRHKLWSPEEAQKTMKNLMKYVDILIANEEDAQLALGISTSLVTTNIKKEDYLSIIKQLYKRYNFELVVITLRESQSASRNKWSSISYHNNSSISSTKYDISIVDRVGAGDSFAGGLIHGLLTYESIKESLEFATASSALKHTIHGDFNQVTTDEVVKLIAGNISGRVER